MKVAIYIERGVTQLVLTPESEWEGSVTDKLLPSGQHAITAYRGEFYECRGGWFRHGYPDGGDKSLILRVDEAPAVPEPSARSIPEITIDPCVAGAPVSEAGR